jgi:hypothetical protein
MNGKKLLLVSPKNKIGMNKNARYFRKAFRIWYLFFVSTSRFPKTNKITAIVRKPTCILVKKIPTDSRERNRRSNLEIGVGLDDLILMRITMQAKLNS